MSPIRFRKRIRLWPLPIYLNGSNSGVSWSAKVGPWSWSSRARRHRIDLPGPLSWEQPKRPTPRNLAQAKPRHPAPSSSAGRAPWILAALAAVGVLAFAFGAPLAALLGGIGAGVGGATIGIRRWRRAQDARVAQPRTLTPSQQRHAFRAAPHAPTCKAKSAATCRCPGIGRAQARRAATAKRKTRTSTPRKRATTKGTP